MAKSTAPPDNYGHSPVHYAVALGDHTTLSRIISSLPRLPDPSLIQTESDSLAQEKIADQISLVLDRRDVPYGETPLHLARRHSSFVREETEWVPMGRKSLDLTSVTAPQPRSVTMPTQTKEKEYVRSLRPSVWLTEQFPLKTEELLPLLDILANKVKAVRRLRELLTTTFPPGTFPVKVAIPVVPTVRVVITFTKFVELQPLEQFYTPFSSPRHLLSAAGAGRGDEEQSKAENRCSSSSSSTWLRRNNSVSNKQRCMAFDSDPFKIPAGYTWTSVDDKSRKMKKSKSVRKPKGKWCSFTKKLELPIESPKRLWSYLIRAIFDVAILVRQDYSHF
ncbi:Ankyrin repeat domain-containing protein 13C [Glycine soja]|nr:Ankyrin repeat domain-containing protein 13C [Glycine soja]